MAAMAIVTGSVLDRFIIEEMRKPADYPCNTRH